ncbi:MAG: class I SAM-dependent methyltransferase [Chloroflexota bacterium]
MADGPEFFAQPGVVDNYHRERPPTESPVWTMEAPAFWRIVGDVHGIRVLDLGCGSGDIGAELLARGAARYVGVDGSPAMVRRARARLDDERASIVHADIRSYRGEAASYDLVVSLRVLHYVDDLASVLGLARDALVPGGRVVYSTEHPVITSFEAREPDSRRTSWLVDDYFRTGRRDVVFLGAPVVKYHRTIEQHLDAVRTAGLRFLRLSECPPVHERFGEDVAEYERRLRIPLLLLIEAERAG